MKLEMIKFGNILNSRPAGREAALRAKQIINGSNDPDGVILDFSNVDVLTPSFADEFIKVLKDFYSNKKFRYQGFDNKVIKDTLNELHITT